MTPWITCPKKPARVGEVDGGLESQFPGLADVVQKGSGEQQVAIDAAVLLPHELAHLGHGDGVLHQAAEVGVVVELGRRSGGEEPEQLGVAEDGTGSMAA